MGVSSEPVSGGGNNASAPVWTTKDATWRPQSNVEWRRSFARLPSELRALVHRGAPNDAFPMEALQEYKHEIQQGRALIDEERKSRGLHRGELGLQKGERETGVIGGTKNTALGKEAWQAVEYGAPHIAEELLKIETPEDFEEYMADVRVGLMEEIEDEEELLDAEAMIRSAWYHRLPPEARKALRERAKPSFSEAVLGGE